MHDGDPSPVRMISRSLPARLRGLTVAEAFTFVSLTATLGLVLAIGFDRRGDVDELAALELPADRMILDCLRRTRANDTVTARQSRPYNCVETFEGDDDVIISQGGAVVRPGPGRDRVFAEEGSKDVQVVYTGGNDIYHFRGGRGILDLSRYARADISFSVSRITTATAVNRSDFDPDNRPPIDLAIATPDGVITAAAHFENQPLMLLVLEDRRMDPGDIAETVIEDQATDGADRIVGTETDDQISAGLGNDRVRGLGGTDVFTYTGGVDTYDPGAGDDLLDLASWNAADVSFSLAASDDDIVISFPDFDNVVVMKGQASAPPSSPDVGFAYVGFSDGTIDAEEILRRALSDPIAKGNREILGSRFSDRITVTGNRDTRYVYPGGGDDTIVYGGGSVVIEGRGGEIGRNTLSIPEVSFREVEIQRTADDAMIVRTPQGAVTILDQFRVNAETPGVIVNLFEFDDELITDATVRTRVNNTLAPAVRREGAAGE